MPCERQLVGKLDRPSDSVYSCRIQESRWEERGLNFLAIALVVAILAILGRKAFAGTDISDFQ